MLGAFVGLLTLIAILNQLPFFQTATNAFISRFNTASEQEGGVQGTLGGRYLGGMLNIFSSSSNIPFFGYGAGIFTNVGSKLLTGTLISGIAEGEWGRMIAELGTLMGVTVIFVRFSLSLETVLKAYRRLSIGDVLPWTLLGYSLLQGPQANWAQPTSLGFSILSIGLVLAASKSSNQRKLN
ncbi:hypothetical protein [Mucilaginibacter agri]|uniref:Uncharacterized protein n=1 Tax=Mucilaginibacter agri TaxID=2695265 RepID=A0A965ZCA6_9SPHI|nr:hypothetical protein [Mucilaginibacter agri]NCD68388.1 hypothetical protein [Mucilaginibacter agri]